MRSWTRQTAAATVLAVIAALGAACEKTALPGPTSVGGIPITERFTGTLQPSGDAFYSFSMPVAGTVSLTLVSMTGPSIPEDALFPVGIGNPVGTGCTAGVDAAIKPSGAPQYSVAKNVGVYCVRIADNARLGAPATFVLNITHPR